jgi:hypothetical protein
MATPSSARCEVFTLNRSDADVSSSAPLSAIADADYEEIVTMSSKRAICCAVLIACTVSTVADAKKNEEVLTCRLGPEDRHARIAVVLVGGKTDSFAYYSKWKPRTCSIYLQRNRDKSKWSDKGNVTTVNVERGSFLIEHKKGEYHFVFRDIDRQRYCGMDGQINGSLTIRKDSEQCELAGIMEEGTKLGQAWAKPGKQADGGMSDAVPAGQSVIPTGARD